jgi:uncharacterized protein (TIRG00374 family)
LTSRWHRFGNVKAPYVTVSARKAGHSTIDDVANRTDTPLPLTAGAQTRGEATMKDEGDSGRVVDPSIGNSNVLTSVRRQILSRGGLLLLTGVSLYFVGPGILEVFSSWDQLSEPEPWWILLAAGCQVMAFGFLWALQRLALRTSAWLPVITSQLASNASSRILPGGPATGAAVQFRLLRSAGINPAQATSGMTAAGLLQLGTTLALPVVALPAVVLGGPVPDSLLNGAWVGAALFAVLLVLAVAVIADDHILTWVGRAIDSVRRQRRARIAAPTALTLLAERDALKQALGEQWERATLYSVGRAMFDFFTLWTALAAFGSDARPSLALLAFASALMLGMIPFTPGGLGFVEAGLTGTLVLAGVSGSEAVSVALLYRLMSFWLPIPAGLIAGVIHQHRFGTTPAET